MSLFVERCWRRSREPTGHNEEMQELFNGEVKGATMIESRFVRAYNSVVDWPALIARCFL